MKRSAKVFLVIVILLALARSSSAYQAGGDSVLYELNGYYKNLIMVSDTHDLYKDFGLTSKRFFLDDYNRLRLKNRIGLGAHFDLFCDYEAFISTGDTILMQYRTERMMTQMAPLLAATGGNEDTQAINTLFSQQGTPRFFDMEEQFPLTGGERIAHNIDRLFFRLNISFFELEAGRMALSWGTGRIWNPTDLWAPFSPVEIDKDEKRGVDLVHTTFSFGKFGALEGVWAPLSLDHHYEIKNEDSSAAGRYKFHIGEYDISVMGGTFTSDTVVGADFTGYILNAGFRGEGAYTFTNPDDNDRDFFRGVLSVDYGFSTAWNPYLLLEYFYNGIGEYDSDEYLNRLSDPSVSRQFTMGRAYNLGRDYVGLMGSVSPHPLVTVTAMPIMNVDDQSAFVNLSAKWTATDYADILAGTNMFFGKENTEYGGLVLDQLDLRLRNADQFYLYIKAYF